MSERSGAAVLGLARSADAGDAWRYDTGAATWAPRSERIEGP
jgi:hypothetical protein